MKKNAVITIAIGSLHQELSKITHPFIEQHAKKINADFIAITEQKISKTTPHWEKFQILDYLNDYDRILYVDTDLLIRKHCPNLFEIVPDSHIGLFNEAPFVSGRGNAIERCAEEYDFKGFVWDGKYYNTGVMVISHYHRYLFRKPEKEICNFCEQSYINLIIQKEKQKIFEIDYKFNRMTCVDKALGKNRFESYIIHYAGVGYGIAKNNLIHEDSVLVETLPDDYVAPKRIWLSVQGGLGDQVQAEPTIRFALEKIWKGSDLRISTHFPDLFSHLPIVCKKHEERLWEKLDTDPFTRITLPGPEAIQWKIVSNLMSHTVDFCSMAVLCRILPDADKSYHLPLDPEAVEAVKRFAKRESLENCFLVHAGRHWPSKTFPLPWWQEVIDGMISLGYTPIFIGKDKDNQGVVSIDGRGKSINLVNLLSTKELIAAVSLTPVLISNDSSPIHIAGAFDNWIVLIPTCKHPDHLLPHRNCSKYYKAIALYKHLALDDMMTSVAEVNGSTAEALPGPWERYLPDTQTVIQEMDKIFKNIAKQAAAS
jgi:hypothetical protein